MVCVVSLCTLLLYSWMFISCHTFAFICCVCDFMVNLKSEGKEKLVSIVSLFWTREFLQGVQSNCLQGVHWQKGSIRDNFCSHFLRGEVRHSAMQGVCRPSKSLRAANLSKVLRTAAARSAQSRETSTLSRGWNIAARSVCKEFSLSKRPRNCGKIRKDRPMSFCKTA